MVYGVIAGLLLAIPIALPPVLFVWYINSGGIGSMLRSARAKRAPVVERG